MSVTLPAYSFYRLYVHVLAAGPYHDHFSNGKVLADGLNRTDGISTTLPCVVGEAAEGRECEEVFASPSLQNEVDVLLICANQSASVATQSYLHCTN